MRLPLSCLPHVRGVPCPLFSALVLVMGTVLGAPPAAAQSAQAQVRVRAHVSADSVQVGERFTVSLTAVHNFQTDVLFPSPDAGPVLFGDLDVIRRSPVQSRYLGADQPGTRIDSVAYTVATFAVDTARVPPLPVRVVANTDTLRAASARRSVPVISVVGPDAQGLRDLAPLVAFPQPVWPWVLLLLVALTAAGGAAYWWWLRQQADDETSPVPEPDPTVSPYEQAMTRLDALQNRELSDSSAVKHYFVELSTILRMYLSRRLDVSAMEHTTPEVVDALRMHPALSDAVIERIRGLLEQADQVKFADVRPAPTISRKAHTAVRSVIGSVEATQRPPEAERTATEPAGPQRVAEGE
jgi:hypothetical protein